MDFLSWLSNHEDFVGLEEVPCAGFQVVEGLFGANFEFHVDKLVRSADTKGVVEGLFIGGKIFMKDVFVVWIDKDDFGLNGHELSENSCSLFGDKLCDVE